MRKDSGIKTCVEPMPVFIIGTYDENGHPNAMNAAWGGTYDTNKIFICLDKHKTTSNLEVSKAFTVMFANAETAMISDYFGVATGNKEDKIAKSGVHIEKSKYVNAPLILEYPLAVECTVDSLVDGLLIGSIKNVSVDEKYVDSDGKIDVTKMQLICYEPINQDYLVVGEKVAKAFKVGLKLK